MCDSPIRKPDCETTYGIPKIPAPIIVPMNVAVAAENFDIFTSFWKQ